MFARMVPPSPLDDPENAAFAWSRYKRLMRLMAWITLGVVAAVLAFLYESDGEASIHFYIATALGVGFTMMLTGGLMGLVFLSSGTGHDESVTDMRDEQENEGNGRG